MAKVFAGDVRIKRLRAYTTTVAHSATRNGAIIAGLQQAEFFEEEVDAHVVSIRAGRAESR